MYRLTANSDVIRDADAAVIPADPANRDYADYLAWIAEGGVPHPVPSPTYAEALSLLTVGYNAEVSKLNDNWLGAAVADGVSETAKKAAVVAAIASCKADYVAAVAALKVQYGVV